MNMLPEMIPGYVQVGFRLGSLNNQVTTAGVPEYTSPEPGADLMTLYDNKPVYFMIADSSMPTPPFELDSDLKMASRFSICSDDQGHLQAMAMVCFYKELEGKKVYSLEATSIQGKMTLKEMIIKLPVISSLMKLIK
jgi:hypothetical protein